MAEVTRRPAGEDADPDADLAALDLTPRAIGAPSVADRRRASTAQKLKVGGFLAVVVLAGGFVLFQGLANATTYFCNADEVGVRSNCMPSDTFRLQGTVDADSVVTDGDVTRFTVSYGGSTVAAQHRGDPPQLFQEGIAVVLEGRMSGALPGGVFESSQILVKHSEEYKEENPDRVGADDL
jgi:cytochrome c-type biogenesis protein CcmE